MRKLHFVLLLVTLTLVLGISPMAAVAQERVLPQKEAPRLTPEVDPTPQPVPPPPPDAQVVTVSKSMQVGSLSAKNIDDSIGPESGLPGPNGSYAILSAILQYYAIGGGWNVRAGGKIDLVTGTSHAYAYGSLHKVNWSSPTAQCVAWGTGECTAWTAWYGTSGQVTSFASTVVYWSSGGSATAYESVSANLP